MLSCPLWKESLHNCFLVIVDQVYGQGCILWFSFFIKVIVLVMVPQQTFRGKLKIPELRAGIAMERKLFVSTVFKMLCTACLSFLFAVETTALFGLWGSCGPTAWIIFVQFKFPALVTIVLPVFNGPNSVMCWLHSFCICGPQALLKACARPPECFSSTLAALTTASTPKVVKSAIQTQTSTF